MRPPTWDVAGFESLIGDALADKARWTLWFSRDQLIQVRRESLEVPLLDMRSAHKAVEIGATWYSSDARGTVVNPESKFLLLQHCFDVLLCERVQSQVRRSQSS